MVPETIRSTWQAARFIARARVDAGNVSTPAADLPDTWGILVSVSDADVPSDAPAVAATADDGRTFTAVPVTRPDALADPAAIAAVARYWELPPTYVAALAAGAPVQ
jgi:hypothetical protein